MLLSSRTLVTDSDSAKVPARLGQNANSTPLDRWAGMTPLPLPCIIRADGKTKRRLSKRQNRHETHAKAGRGSERALAQSVFSISYRVFVRTRGDLDFQRMQ